MKILMLTSWYPDAAQPNSGIFIRSQVNALAVHHAVTVISSKVDYRKFSIFSYRADHQKQGNVTEHRIVVARSLPLYNQLNYIFVSSLVALRVARKFKPDVIHASIGYPGAFWGWVLSRLTRVPFVFTEHTKVTNNFRSFFHRWATLFGLRRAASIMAVSESLANELRKLLGRRVDVVPNIVEVNKFMSVTPEMTVVPQLGFLGGMNTNVKGLDILLNALAGIPREFVLHIGGTGSQEDLYRRMAADLGIATKCKFYGFIPPQELPSFMGRLNFFVCSSRYETFCVALVEAIASGLPVVSTRCGGPEDFVNDINGVLCAKEDVAALRSAIDNMLDNYGRYSHDAVRQTAKRFEPSEIAGKLTAIYTGAAASSAS